MTTVTEIELSRPIVAEHIRHDKDKVEEIEATAEECEALCKRMDLQNLSNFKATVTLKRVTGGDVVRVAGRFEADVVQTCVVTLEPVPSHIKGEFETFFSEDGISPEDEQNMTFDLDNDEELPEKIMNGKIDVGELVSQYLSLELDPFPRLPGAALKEGEMANGAKSNPFEILENIKNKQQED